MYIIKTENNTILYLDHDLLLPHHGALIIKELY
jgi:hypothetical protein